MTSIDPEPQDWSYETAPDLDKNLVDRLSSFPREPEIHVFLARSLAAVLLRGWLRVYHRYRVVGHENVPGSDESFVMVCNHSSHLDTLALISAMPLKRRHRVFPAAAQDYFFNSVPKTLFTAVIINGLPFSRSVHIAQSLKLCHELLSNPGNVLILFPEGTRTSTGEVESFKPGIGRLLAGVDIPALPCFLRGAFAAMPKGSTIPRPAKLELHIGEPLRFKQTEASRDGYRVVANHLHEAVNALRNQQ